jgi:hypothetical protein
MVPIAQKLGGSMLQVQGQLLDSAEIPLDADLYDLSVEELLEVTGGHVMHCGPFNVVAKKRTFINCGCKIMSNTWGITFWTNVQTESE